MKISLLIIVLLFSACSSKDKQTPINYPVENAIPSLDGFTQQDEAIFGSAFIYSVSSNNLQDAKRLLQLGADINEPDPVNKTPLEIAIDENSVEMVDFLLAHGANPNYYLEPVSCSSILINGSAGDIRFYIMPLEQAQKKGNPAIIDRLIKAGAKSASECFDAESAERRLLESLAPVY